MASQCTLTTWSRSQTAMMMTTTTTELLLAAALHRQQWRHHHLLVEAEHQRPAVHRQPSASEATPMAFRAARSRLLQRLHLHPQAHRRLPRRLLICAPAATLHSRHRCHGASASAAAACPASCTPASAAAQIYTLSASAASGLRCMRTRACGSETTCCSLGQTSRRSTRQLGPVSCCWRIMYRSKC